MLREKLRAALFVPGERKSDRFFRWFPWIWLAAGYLHHDDWCCACTGGPTSTATWPAR